MAIDLFLTRSLTTILDPVLSQAFEQYDSVEDAMATKALKYMLLSKVN